MVNLIYFDTVHTVPMLPRKKDPFRLFLSVLVDLIFTNTVHITNYKHATAAKRPTSQQNVQEVCLFAFGSAANINPSTNHSLTFWHMLTGPFQQSAMFFRTVPSSSLLLFLPSSSLHLPRHTCFSGCRLHDEVHLLRDFGSHLYFPLSLLFGVSVLLMRVGERESERAWLTVGDRGWERVKKNQNRGTCRKEAHRPQPH